MMFLGLDLSLNKSGICKIDDYANPDDIFTCNVHDILSINKKINKFEKIDLTVQFINDFIKKNKVDYVGKEGYSFNSMRMQATSSITVLAELNGVVDYILAKNGFSIKNDNYFIFAPTKIKKFTLTKGNVSKDTSYLLKVLDKTGKRFSTDDEADAYMVASLLMNLIHIRSSTKDFNDLYDYQLECVLDEDKLKRDKLTIKKWKKLNEPVKMAYILGAKEGNGDE